jgi:glutamate synthase domain-containing protein 2
MADLGWKTIMALLNPFIDEGTERLLTKDYYENLFLMLPAIQKLSITAIVEAAIRSELGQGLARPFGSPNVLSPWNKILLNPRQLFELPTESLDMINTKTVIGARAKRPLEIDIPIMITAMSNGGSLSEQMKVALAKGASIAGTATNTGESTVVASERNAAKYLIGQYNRGGWLNTPDKLNKLDAIEVQLGQGAWGGAIDEVTPSDEVNDYQRKIWELKKGQDAVIHARMPGINSSQDIINLLNSLKSQYDVPVGVKIAASHFLEKELSIIAQTEVDFIVLDGAEGGTSSAFPTTEDNMGLPTLYALGRAANWLEKNNLKNKYNLIIAGGLTTPGHFLKALALGADALYIGSIALMASIQTQAKKALPEEEPAQLAIWNGKLTNKLDIDEASSHLANFLKSCIIEMKQAVQGTSKKAFKDLNKDDLVTTDIELSKVLKIAYAGNACE